MNTQKIMTTSTIGQVHTLTDSANYQADPLAVYHKICGDNNHNILLESAEVDKKHQLKSLLLTHAALKMVCNGNTVTFTALTDNGLSALAFAKQALKEHAELTTSANQLIAIFPEVTQQLDEKSRLLAINPFQCLRLFNDLTPALADELHDFSVFLGGAFAFDMMSMSEKLPDVAEGENTCPDFVYYLAETLIVIDHEEQTSEIIGNVFSGTDVEQSNKTIRARISELKTLLKPKLLQEVLEDLMVIVQYNQNQQS